MNSCTYSGPDSDNLHREGTMCTSLTRNRSMNPTRGLQPARHGPVASRQSTRRLLRERSLQPLAPYAPAARSRRSLRSIRSRRSHPTLSPLAPYAPVARFILSRRSLRSLHVPTPPDSVHSAGTSFHGFFVGTVYVSSGSEANRHGPKGMICFAIFFIPASQNLVILLRKFR